MWLFVGTITLLLSVLSVFLLRRRYRLGGDRALIQIQYQEQPLSIHIQSKQNTQKGSNTGYLLGVECSANATFSIHRESDFDRFGKSMGITREYSLGDAELDKILFLDSNDVRISQVFIGNEDARGALRAIFLAAPHQTTLVMFQNRLWIDVRGIPHTLPAEGELRTLVERLHRIAAAVVDDLQKRSASHDPFYWRAGIILAITLGSAVFGVLGLIRIKSAPELLNPATLWWIAIPTGLALTVMLFFLSWRWLHDSARAHRVLLEVLLLGSVGLILTSVTLLREANTDLDTQAARVHRINNAEAVMESYRCGKRKRRTCYRYYLSLPENPTGKLRLKLSSAQYQAFEGESKFDIAIKPGWLGLKWVEKIQTPQSAER
jgi:hypothetical protein